jgi:hypothetical protein
MALPAGPVATALLDAAREGEEVERVMLKGVAGRNPSPGVQVRGTR